MATHSGVLAWRIPWTGEPGWLPSMGSHRVGHDWSNLVAAAVYNKDWKVFPVNCQTVNILGFGAILSLSQLLSSAIVAWKQSCTIEVCSIGCSWLSVNKSLFIKVDSGPELFLGCSLLTPSVAHHITFIWQFSVACQNLKLKQCKAATKSDCKLQDLWHLWKWGRIIAQVKLKSWTSENMAELDQWKREESLRITTA